MTYYAVTRNALGQIEQVRVTATPGQRTEQEWTGVLYRTERDARESLERLNGERSGR